MASINISLKEEAYKFLLSLKGKDESFSDIILEFKEKKEAKKGSKEALLDFYGGLRKLDVDWSKKEETMREFRKNIAGRLNDRMGH